MLRKLDKRKRCQRRQQLFLLSIRCQLIILYCGKVWLVIKFFLCSSKPNPANPPIVVTTPRAGGNIDSNAFFCPLLGSVMIGNEHGMLTKFLKLKPLVQSEDTYEFILYYYERHHYLGLVHHHRVEFVSFQHHKGDKQWWRAFME